MLIKFSIGVIIYVIWDIRYERVNDCPVRIYCCTYKKGIMVCTSHAVCRQSRPATPAAGASVNLTTAG